MGTTRAMIAACLCCWALFQAAPASAEVLVTPAKVAFYFAAHEDDWQLFMTPSAFEDVTNDTTKSVFIHVTAGDGGLGMGDGGRKHPFYRARENGAEAAIRFMVNKDYDTPLEKTVTRVKLNGHKLYRLRYRNAVAYFLRLPDGNYSGAGYESTGSQSLKHLADGDNDTIAAIDGSTVYHGWGDLVATVRAIIDLERGSAPAVSLNVADLDQTHNPQDHSDHLMTARAALDAAEDLACAQRVYYVDYASARLPENLTSEQRDMASSVFAVTLAGVLALDHRVAWHRYDRSYVGRSYFRVEDGKGRCEAPLPLLSSAGSVTGKPAGRKSTR